MSRSSWAISITFADTNRNEFLCLGGAAWWTKSEAMNHWEAITTCADRTWLMAELRRPNDDIEDEKEVSWATVEKLLGKPLQELILDARIEGCE